MSFLLFLVEFWKNGPKEKNLGNCGVSRNGEGTPRNGKGTPRSGEGSPHRNEAVREGWPDLGFVAVKLSFTAAKSFVAAKQCFVLFCFVLLCRYSKDLYIGLMRIL